jgi:adenylate kinase family enzyme
MASAQSTRRAADPVRNWDVERIAVVGPSGAGKTTVARSLAARLALPHTELDALWWDPDWTEVDDQTMRARTEPVVRGPRWVVDGNYYSAVLRDVIWPRADTVVWLDLPRWRTIGRVARRTVRRSITRAELWNGNREKLGSLYRRDELLRFAWTAYPKYAARYSKMRTDPACAHLTVIRLDSPRAVRQWLAGLP